MTEINKEWLTVRQYSLASNYSGWIIPVGGYLIAVSAEIDKSAPYIYPEDPDTTGIIRCEITDTDHTALYGEFEIQHGYGFYQGGILFNEPLPNVNTREPYLLSITGKHSPVIIYTIQCMTK